MLLCVYNMNVSKYVHIYISMIRMYIYMYAINRINVSFSIINSKWMIWRIMSISKKRTALEVIPFQTDIHLLCNLRWRSYLSYDYYELSYLSYVPERNLQEYKRQHCGKFRNTCIVMPVLSVRLAFWPCRKLYYIRSLLLVVRRCIAFLLNLARVTTE